MTASTLRLNSRLNSKSISVIGNTTRKTVEFLVVAILVAAVAVALTEPWVGVSIESNDLAGGKAIAWGEYTSKSVFEISIFLGIAVVTSVIAVAASTLARSVRPSLARVHAFFLMVGGFLVFASSVAAIYVVPTDPLSEGPLDISWDASFEWGALAWGKTAIVCGAGLAAVGLFAARSTSRSQRLSRRATEELESPISESVGL